MVLNKEMCGILAAGAEKERMAHDLYLEAARKVWHPLGKKMFEMLAEEEAKHEQLLKGWSVQGVCPARMEAAALDKDFLARARARVKDAAKPSTSDLEAITLGQDMERKSIQFYLEAAAQAPDPVSRDLFLRLKAEEDRHLALLTDLHSYLANPNVWMTREGKAHFDA